MDNNNKEDRKSVNEDDFSEANLIKKLLLTVMMIMIGIVFINIELAQLMIPGIVIMITGLLSFILILSFNASQINQYDD
ncbi:MAG: hypothetical protein ACOCQ5_02905 [Halanaerobiales bacterium]